MAHYALIGRTLQHSFSKRFFDSKFQREGLADTYELLELNEVAEIGLAIEQHELSGFNVTIPYKQQIMPLLDALTPEAREIGAVNVVKVNGKQLTGYNTDAPAFEATLRPLLKSWHDKALILGTGGASKAVAFALRQLGISYTFVSRTPKEVDETDYQTAAIMAKETFLIVNTTPVGTWPNENEMPPLPLDGIENRHLCYDLIYNPMPTQWLKECTQRGAASMGGLEMLHTQAELSWKIWTER